MSRSAIATCCAELARKNWKISFVESASAGRLSYEFSLDANSGKVLLGGSVCYDARLKQDLLGIPKALIEKYTAESAEVTAAMAESFQRLSKADVFVGLTGLTSPGGSESAEKPVGTIFTHILMPGKSIADRTVFEGSPEIIVSKTVEHVAQLLIRHLSAKAEITN